jgi:hypothetical protein
MFGKMSRAAFVLCLMLMSFAAAAKAQDTISPAKRELIKELLSLTGGQKNTEAILNSMLDQNERNLPALLSQTASKNLNLTASEQVAFQEKLRESMIRASKRFRELFQQRVNFVQLMEDISFSLNDKYFSESELRDLVEFYKSPTGKKTIEILPQLLTESMTKTSEVLLPKVQQIIDELLEEEMQRLKSERPPAGAKTGAKTGAKKRRRP